MLSRTAIYSLKTTKTFLPRALAVRGFTIGSSLKGKEKVEEERYMRELEKKFIAKKKAEKESEMKAHEQEEFDAKVAPAMAQAQSLLESTGNTGVSEDGLEALARWKLDL